MQGALNVCHKSSVTSSKVCMQRSEVEEILTGTSGLRINSMGGFGAVGSLVAKHQSSESKYSNTTSMNSQLMYMEPDQTIIVYDWDDTLCPSAWVRLNVRFDRRGKVITKLDDEALAQLTALADQVVALLRASRTMGKVVIVTNARRPWVNTSCNALLPSVAKELENIDLIYAMELLNKDEQDYVANPLMLIESKARAMKAAVATFYSRYKSQSWKNMVSIGDAQYEHTAIRMVAGDRPTLGKKCRTKTIKLIEGPTTAVISNQLSVLESWLANIVLADDDVEIDMGNLDIEALMRLNDSYSNPDTALMSVPV